MFVGTGDTQFAQFLLEADQLGLDVDSGAQQEQFLRTQLNSQVNCLKALTA